MDPCVIVSPLPLSRVLKSSNEHPENDAQEEQLMFHSISPYPSLLPRICHLITRMLHHLLSQSAPRAFLLRGSFQALLLLPAVSLVALVLPLTLLLKIHLLMTNRKIHRLTDELVLLAAVLLSQVALLVPLVCHLTLLLRIRLPMKMTMIRTHSLISSSRLVIASFILLIISMRFSCENASGASWILCCSSGSCSDSSSEDPSSDDELDDSLSGS